ncbi:MAG: hypothetical protein K0R24_269 [Gammaproteobacteria bacterium]|jgi:hypothetical protein|nr:hypothetical protein [Gammaproteobacteria bacterium]
MQFLKYVVVLSLICCGVTFAKTDLPPRKLPKEVVVPFENQPIISDRHAGLSFNFDIRGSLLNKVICIYKGSNSYKSWIVSNSFDNNVPHGSDYSNTFGGNEIITVTSRRADETGRQNIQGKWDDSIIVRHINTLYGNITVYAEDNTFGNSQDVSPTLSCHYEPEI